MSRRSWVFVAIVCASLAALSTIAAADDAVRYRVDITGGDVDVENVPLSVSIPFTDRWPIHLPAALVGTDGMKLPVQLTRPARAESPEQRLHATAHFVLPKLAAGEKQSWTLEIARTASAAPRPAGFQWTDKPGEQNELAWAMPLEPSQSPFLALRYMCAPLDDSSAERRQETYKPYHHVFARDSRTLLTKGPGGKYPHHRGLFFGFNKVTYGDGVKCDVWHCTGDAFQSHEEVLDEAAGQVLGSQRTAINWHGKNKDVFANEDRTLTVYGPPGGWLIEFASTVRTAGGPIHLDGDPQHAGFHFRAAQEVAEKTADQTYYLRPDGRGKPGETRNWPDQKDHVNLPWNAMSFVVEGKRYTALYLDHPSNPKEARYSERDYGRFGSYFVYDVTEDKPLSVRYRVWVQEGEMTPEQCAALSAAFVNPPKVTATPL